MILGVIPARGGSKGVPRKNIKPLHGKPLIHWAIACAKACPSLDAFVVSTDDAEIAEVAAQADAKPPFLRPAHLASDSAAMLPVLEHAILEMEKIKGTQVQYLILLDPTAPLRKVEDVEAVISLLKKGECETVVSGSPAHRNPWFNMVKEKNGYVELAVNDGVKPARRQDCPTVYDLNTVAWGFTRKAIMELKERIPEKTKIHLTPRERSVDLDTDFDFKILELMMKEKQ